MKTEDERLWSLDALRGFDMIFIIGILPVIAGVCGLLGFGGDCWLLQQMRHSAWHGFTQRDTIFPLFLFIAGVAFPYSYAKQVARGRSTARICLKIFTRALLLFFFGLVYSGFFARGIKICTASVLGRIGFAWMFAAFIYIAFRTRARIAVAIGILVGYWAIMRYWPVPGAPAGADVWGPDWNFAAYVDRLFLPNSGPKGHPEGIMGTFPAIVSALLGMFAGDFIRWKSDVFTGARKTLVLLGAAAVFALLALAFQPIMPINKKIWTSTFVLANGAYSLAFFALFYWVVDVLKWRRWTFFFRVIGLNAILIYLLQKIVDFDAISKFFLGGVAGQCTPNVAKILLGLGHVMAGWFVLWFCYKKETFLRC